jgi:hypothetical protein
MFCSITFKFNCDCSSSDATDGSYNVYTIIYVPNRYFHKDFNLLQNQHDIKYANDSFAHFDLKYRQRTPKLEHTQARTHLADLAYSCPRAPLYTRENRDLFLSKSFHENWYSY